MNSKAAPDSAIARHMQGEEEEDIPWAGAAAPLRKGLAPGMPPGTAGSHPEPPETENRQFLGNYLAPGTSIRLFD